MKKLFSLWILSIICVNPLNVWGKDTPLTIHVNVISENSKTKEIKTLYTMKVFWDQYDAPPKNIVSPELPVKKTEPTTNPNINVPQEEMYILLTPNLVSRDMVNMTLDIEMKLLGKELIKIGDGDNVYTPKLNNIKRSEMDLMLVPGKLVEQVIHNDCEADVCQIYKVQMKAALWIVVPKK